MTQFTTEPPLPAKPTDAPFVQLVRLTDGDTLLAHGYWHTSGRRIGTIQIIDLQVEKGLRRQGIGGQLLDAIIAQGVEYHRRRRRTLRQIWFAVAQKGEITGRAFLMKSNFHHISTISDVFSDEDILIYKRSLD